jgi:hypothetical protein
VCAEVLDDADVLDAVREGADALGSDQQHLAELVIAPPQLHQRRIEALDMADPGADARPSDDVDDLAGLGGRRRQGLLDQHVRPARGERADGAQVVLGRHGDDREVDLRQLVERGEDAGRVVDRAEAVSAGVDGADELDVRGCLQQARVMPADHAQPEHGAAQRSCRNRGGHCLRRLSA